MWGWVWWRNPPRADKSKRLVACGARLFSRQDRPRVRSLPVWRRTDAKFGHNVARRDQADDDDEGHRERQQANRLD
eukprot:6381691-Prymnesium_polylepis.1